MAVVDDPTTRQVKVQEKAGAYAGVKKYGEAANLPTTAMKKRGGSPSHRAPSSPSPRPGASSPSPLRGGSTAEGGRGGGSSKVHKPHLDEMHGPESLPYRPTRSLPEKPFGGGSKIIQPANSRDSGPEFGPAPRSTGGAPGKRGGWKRR
jgi:excinuclease ABC subunit B